MIHDGTLLFSRFYARYHLDPAWILFVSMGNEVGRHENLFTPVSVRRRCAAQGCADAHPNAHSAVGRDDEVDIGFGRD